MPESYRLLFDGGQWQMATGANTAGLETVRQAGINGSFCAHQRRSIMFSLYVALLKLVRTTIHASKDPEFRALCVTMTVLLSGGTIFYVRAEGWSVIDSLYFCVMTMATVGYGDLTPSTGLSKVFTMVYSLLSIGVFVAVVSRLAASMLEKRRHSDGDKSSSARP